MNPEDKQLLLNTTIRNKFNELYEQKEDGSYYPDIVPPPDVSDGFDGFNENDNIPF